MMGVNKLNPNKKKINIKVNCGVTLAICPPGLFLFGDNYGFRTEYTDENGPEAYCITGEYFWGGAKNSKDRSLLTVNPCIIME
jgi:hypothetical protein